jgi:hypothetical protein
MRSRISRQSILLTIALLITGLWPASRDLHAQANRPLFSGEATVIKGSVAGVSLDLAGTGPLAPEGGARENSLVCYPGGPNCTISSPVGDPTNGALSARVLHASTVGRGEQSRSEASVASVSVKVAGVLIEAEVLRSFAQATCQAGIAAVEAGSELVDLTAAGFPLDVTGAPNQTFKIPSPLGGDVTIVINEQKVKGGGNTGDITVNALHITFPGFGLIPPTDVIIAQAHADIKCGQPDCNFASKVTSGGWVVAEDGARINFAAAGRNLDTWGHFLAVNHRTGDKLKATALETTAGTVDDEGFAVITGSAQVNGESGYSFIAKLKDNGEPGKGIDQFSLEVPTHPDLNVPLTTLSGGNIQFHKPCKPGGI